MCEISSRVTVQKENQKKLLQIWFTKQTTINIFNYISFLIYEFYWSGDLLGFDKTKMALH